MQSGFVVCDPEAMKPIADMCGKFDNAQVLDALDHFATKFDDVVIEMVASYGMPVGAEVFETVYWIGRFAQAAEAAGAKVHRIKRLQVKQHICHDSRAKDSNIRQALIDRFGPVGTKKDKGWFYGFKADMWAAYALAVTFAETRESEESQ
jgi:hypothetical protein